MGSATHKSQPIVVVGSERLNRYRTRHRVVRKSGRCTRTPTFTNSLFIELFNAAVDQHNLENEDGALQLTHTARELLLDYEERDPYKRDVQINLFKTEVLLSSWGQTEFSEQAVERSETIFKLYPAYLSMLQLVADDMPFNGRDDLEIEYNARINAGK